MHGASCSLRMLSLRLVGLFPVLAHVPVSGTTMTTARGRLFARRPEVLEPHVSSWIGRGAFVKFLGHYAILSHLTMRTLITLVCTIPNPPI